MNVGEGFATPREAALEGWRSTPAANARVVSETIRNDRAEVVIETEQSERGDVDYVYCVQGTNGRWREAVSGNGPTIGWGDPAEYDWTF